MGCDCGRPEITSGRPGLVWEEQNGTLHATSSLPVMKMGHWRTIFGIIRALHLSNTTHLSFVLFLLIGDAAPVKETAMTKAHDLVKLK